MIDLVRSKNSKSQLVWGKSQACSFLSLMNISNESACLAVCIAMWTLALADLAERQIKQMVNKEDKHRIFSVLRFDIKGSIDPASIIRSSVSRIDITQQDGSIIAVTTK
jgi:hypothetical protein